MQQAWEKIKLSLDIKTFLFIITTVGSITFSTAAILNKINLIAMNQDKQAKAIESLIATRDTQHREIDQKLAWLEPAVELVMKKVWL